MTRPVSQAQRRRKGANFEAAVVRDQERIGRWAARLRSGGGEIVDVIALERGGPVYFIQCKVGGYMLPSEREALIECAVEVGAIPLKAFRLGRTIHYGEV